MRSLVYTSSRAVCFLLEKKRAAAWRREGVKVAFLGRKEARKGILALTFSEEAFKICA